MVNDMKISKLIDAKFSVRFFLLKVRRTSLNEGLANRKRTSAKTACEGF